MPIIPNLTLSDGYTGHPDNSSAAVKSSEEATRKFKKAVQKLDKCDSTGLLNRYNDFLHRTQTFVGLKETNVYEIIVKGFTNNSGQISKPAIESFCSQLEKLGGAEADPSFLSIMIQKFLEAYYIKNNFDSSNKPDHKEASFETFFNLYKENQSWQGFTSLDILYKALHNVIVNPHACIGKEIAKLFSKKAPNEMQGYLASIDFSNVDTARKGLHEAVRKSMEVLVEGMRNWNPKLDINLLVQDHFSKHIEADGDALKAFVAEFKTKLLAASYENLEDRFKDFISITDFKTMIENNTLVREVGEVKISSEVGASQLAHWVVSYGLAKNGIQLDGEQQQRMVAKIFSLPSLRALSGFIGCEELEKFQNQVKELAFDQLLEACIKGELCIRNDQINAKQLSKIKSDFLKLSKNDFGEDQGLDGNFFTEWFEKQVIAVSGELTTELYSTVAPSSEELARMTTILDGEKQLGQAYYQLTNPPAELGRNSGSYSTTHALPTSDASVRNVSPNSLGAKRFVYQLSAQL